MFNENLLGVTTGPQKWKILLNSEAVTKYSDLLENNEPENVPEQNEKNR